MNNCKEDTTSLNIAQIHFELLFLDSSNMRLLPHPRAKYMYTHFLALAWNTLTIRLYIITASHSIQKKAARKK